MYIFHFLLQGVSEVNVIKWEKTEKFQLYRPVRVPFKNSYRISNSISVIFLEVLCTLYVHSFGSLIEGFTNFQENFLLPAVV